jgi:hypothetical protein
VNCAKRWEYGRERADQDAVALAVLSSFSLSWLLVKGVAGGTRISDVMIGDHDDASIDASSTSEIDDLSDEAGSGGGSG